MIIIPNIAYEWIDESVESGKTYYYMITAMNINGESEPLMKSALVLHIQLVPLLLVLNYSW